MNRLIHVLENEFSNIHGSSATPLDIAETQRGLVDNKIIPMPNSYVNFLEHINGINYNGGEIFGVKPPRNLAGDVLDINLRQERFPKSNFLVLGVDEFDYLVYNQEQILYQIIDKSDLEVLEEYPDVENAIWHILKI